MTTNNPPDTGWMKLPVTNAAADAKIREIPAASNLKKATLKATLDAGELTIKGKLKATLEDSTKKRALPRSSVKVGEVVFEVALDETALQSRLGLKAKIDAIMAASILGTHPRKKFRAGGEVSYYGDKGSLILKVGEYTLSRLYFTRMPSNWETKIQANIARGKIPGASADSIQKLGAGSVEYKMKVLFSNAWAPVTYGSTIKEKRSVEGKWTPAGDAVKRLIDLVRSGWQGSLYWDKGGGEQVVPIVLESVQISEGVFIPSGKSEEFKHLYNGGADGGKYGGDAQHVEASLSFIVVQESKYHVPYKSKRKSAARRSRRHVATVTVSGGTDNALQLDMAGTYTKEGVANNWRKHRAYGGDPVMGTPENSVSSVLGDQTVFTLYRHLTTRSLDVVVEGQ
jgi:hypothetical protein